MTFSQFRQRINQPNSRGSSGQTLCKPLSNRLSVSSEVASMSTGRTCLPSRGRSPALTSDDLPQPDGP